MKTYFQGNRRSICWSVVGCFISRHTYNLYIIKYKINMQWTTTRLKASVQEHHYTRKCYFFGKNHKVALHNHTIWFLLSYRIISASVCVSVPRNCICKNPTISKLAITVSPSPRKKAAPISPWSPDNVVLLFFAALSS